ncbi:MAG: FecR family protein [Luteimonas sp.]
MSSHKEIEELAAYLISRAEGPDWSTQDQTDLDAWLGQEVAHRVAWLRLKSVWQRADRLAAVGGTQLPSVQHWPQSNRWAIAAAMALVAVLVNVLWLAQESRYNTGVGGRELVSLSDGSRLELNTRTVLRTHVDETVRHVWLDRGEAFFDIKSDPEHPFVVHVGDHKVVVLGTKFSVRKERDRLEVAVLEGRVRVEQLVADPRKPPVIVHGGDMLYGESSRLVVALNVDSKVRRSLSWRHGTLEFDQSSLAVVADQFNRYNHKQLVLMDPQTAQIRVGGSFDATGVDAFARLLANGFDLHVETKGNEIQVSQPH